MSKFFTLEDKLVVKSNFYSLYGKRRLTSCTLLTRQKASVLKVGMPCGL